MPIVNATIKLRGGSKSTLPTLSLREVAVTTDTYEMYVGTPSGNKLVGGETFVKLAGDTMTGYLTLHADPTNNLHAATKQYVDGKISDHEHTLSDITDWPTEVSPTEVSYLDGVTSNIQTQIDSKVSKSGDTMTGYLTLHADPSTDMHAATKQYVDTKVSKSGDTMTGYLTLHADPINDMHAVTKRYVDGISAGIKWKEPVLVSTVSNIDINQAPSSIDGVSLSVGDRILVKNQTSKSQNGIYVFGGEGQPLTRSADANTWNELVNAAVFVSKGNTYADRGFVCISDPGGTLDTDDIEFVQFSSIQAYTWGNGLDYLGTLVFVGEGDGIVTSENAVSVNIDVTSGLKFDSSSPKKIQLNVDTDVFGFDNGALILNLVDGGTW